jgi:signal transduction histidine kinase
MNGFSRLALVEGKLFLREKAALLGVFGLPVTLLRVAQEALANVAKHAAASHAWVTLSYMGDVVTLDVRDDGTGFSQPGVSPGISPGISTANGSGARGGFGLIAMRQRVDRLAGQLEIESEPGAGTAVSASLPAIALGGPS